MKISVEGKRGDTTINLRMKNRFKIKITNYSGCASAYVDYITKFGGYNYQDNYNFIDQTTEEVSSTLLKIIKKAPKYRFFKKRPPKPEITPYEFKEPVNVYANNVYKSNNIIWAEAEAVVLEGRKIYQEKEMLAKPNADTWFLIYFRRADHNDAQMRYGLMLFDGDKFIPVRDCGVGGKFISLSFQNPFIKPEQLTTADRDILRGLINVIHNEG
jgi:hypothetical protein